MVGIAFLLVVYRYDERGTKFDQASDKQIDELASSSHFDSRCNGVILRHAAGDVDAPP